uniref:Carcinoembryonic antigen-related cell adhesion molecule 1-like n=1 Tax=Oncorhynchus kisutch TaxID=8019 RepID=A0A8C7FK83_ONCKI
MSKLKLIRLCFWFYLVRTVVSKDDLYHEVGGELVLTPDKSTVPDSITSIIWKHGKNKVAEWDQAFGGLDIYGAFKERTTLDNTTGELRISGLKKTDSGVYSVEFNSKLLKTYTLSVLKAVPKPTITSSCNPDKTSCTLTCEGDTTDAEPVTYSWKVGASAWEVLDKQIDVNKSDTGKSTNSYKYICKMKNPVSEEVSDPIGQRFGPKAVPKPTITYTCNSNKTTCILTCESDTTDAEPVTYSWKVGEGAWEVIEKWLIVSKSDTGKSTNSYKYICKLKNSAGEGEVSDPVGSVFYPGEWTLIIVLILCVDMLVTMLVL